jgi:hypothetical protein
MRRKGVYCIAKKRRRSGSPKPGIERLRCLSEERQGEPHQRPIQAALIRRLAIFAMVFRLHRVAACTALQLWPAVSIEVLSALRGTFWTSPLQN